MAVILQSDSLPLPYVLTIVGMIVAFISGSVTNLIKDKIEQMRMRGALYSEIISMHDALRHFSVKLKTIANYQPPNKMSEANDLMRREVLTLQKKLSGDTYKYVKAMPALFLGIKDIHNINDIYNEFSNFLEFDILEVFLSPRHKGDIWEIAALLQDRCQKRIAQLEQSFGVGVLDKRLLLKKASPFLDPYWEKILKKPLKDFL